MKKIILFFLTAWLVLFSFGLSYPQFNLYIRDHLLFYQADNPLSDNVMVSVNLEFNSSDAQDFHKAMNETFTNNDVYFSRYFSDENSGGSRKTQLYLSDLASQQVSHIIGNSWANEINQTDSNIISRRIPMIFPTEKIDIDGVINDDETGGFFLFGCQCDNLNDRIEAGFSEISSNYTFTYQIQYSANALNFNYAYTLIPNFQLITFISFVIWTCFLFSLITRRKELAILKLECLTNLFIFFKFVESPFLIILLISFISCGLMGVLLLYEYPTLIIVFISFCFVQLASMCLMSQLLLLTLNLFIHAIKGVSSIKGKSEADTVLSLSMSFKMILIIVLMPQIFPMFKAIKDGTNYTIHYFSNKNQFTDLYIFNEGIPSNLTYELIGSQPLLDVNEVFIQNNQLFTYSPGMFLLDQAQNEILYAVRVDQVYLQQYLDSSTLYDPNRPLIIYPPNYPYKESLTELIWGEMSLNNTRLVRDELQIIEITLDNFKSYDLYEILTGGTVNQPLYMYSYPPELQGQLNFKYITVNSDIESPQEYVNQVFADHGFSPLFRLSPVRDQLKDLYESYMNLTLQTIVQAGSYLLALIILEVISTLTLRYLQSNEITVWSIEGLRSAIKWRYFIYLLSPTIFGFSICIFLSLFSGIKYALLTLIFVILLEVFVYNCTFGWRSRYGN